MQQEKPLGRAQWLVLAASFLGWMFDGVEIGLFPLVARPALNELLSSAGDEAVGFWNGVVVAAFLLGAALGGLVFGWLGDRIGRVRAMVISVLAYSIFTGAGAFATAAWQLAAFRFIASLGMGGEWAVAVALVVECWPERHRPKLAGAIGAASNVGFLMIAAVAYCYPVVSGSWRWLMLVGASPAVLALFISLLVPESEKWQQSRKTARRSPVLEIFSRQLRWKTILGITFSAIPLIGTWAAVSGWIPLWVEQKKEVSLVDAAMPELGLAAAAEKDYKKVLADAKSRLPESTWSEFEAEAARSKAASQMMLALGAIIGGFIAPIVGGLWGRRPVYFGLCLLSLAVCGYLFGIVRILPQAVIDVIPLTLQEAFSGFTAFGGTFLLTCAIAGAVTAGFYGWLPLYLPELFPTHVRATGQGLSYNFGRILAAVGTIYMGGLVSLFGGDYRTAMATITLIYIVGMVLIWLAPETKGKPLPE